MRVTAISAAMLLSHGEAASSQDIDPRLDADLLECISVVQATGGLAMGLAARGEVGFAREILELNPEPIAAQTALTIRLWEEANCEMDFDVLAEAIDAATEVGTDRFVAAAGDASRLRSLWAEFEPRLSCLDVLSQSDMARGRQIIEQGTGYPCGYQPE